MIILLLAVLAGEVASKEGPAFLPRLHVGENGRFLVTEAGEPFFWLADTAWSIIDQSVRESSDKQPGVEVYFEHRKAQGFNVVQTHFLTNMVRGPIDAPNAYGLPPFIDGDFARPRVLPGPANDYWDYADTVIDLAGEYGLYVAIVAAWSNSLETDQHPMVRDPHVAYTYGHFLGERYKERKHLIWLLGGDTFGRPDRAILSPSRLQMTRALAEGIADGVNGVSDFDGQADWTSTLMSYHPPGGGKSSSEFVHDESWLDFNMIQSTSRFGFKNYQTVAADYDKRPIKPTLDSEVAYEDSFPLNQRELLQRPGDRISSWDVRRGAYWNVFAGALGHTYGHRNLIGWVCVGDEPMKHGADRPWFESLEAPGARQMKHLKALVESRPMLIRVPDPSLVVLSQEGAVYPVQSARGADGSYAFAYLPTGEPVTVDLSRLSGETVVAFWYDPRNGKSSMIGTFPSTGLHHFAPASLGPEEDWILVLDDASHNYPPPGER